MKLVVNDRDLEELYSLKTLLESKGIPAYISGEGTARVLPFLMSKPALWIYIDEQYEEAAKLLHDPDYDVVNRVDIDRFYELAQHELKENESANSVFLGVVFYAALIIAALIMIIKFLHWMQA